MLPRLLHVAFRSKSLSTLDACSKMIISMLFSFVIYSNVFSRSTYLEVFAHSTAKDLPLLLISFDGFRYNYLSRTATPNFDRVISNGVRVKNGIKNVFVSNTLPNHWTMVTGLYTESHGVLDNFIKDPAISKPFIPKYRDPDYRNDPRYYDAGGEPIWVTNQMQQHNGRSGSVMWWGSENPVKWVRPTEEILYSDEVSNKEKIDTVVKWFTSEYPINLGLVYFPEPDHTAHATGPESSNVTEQIKKADETIGYLLQKLEKEDLLDDLNIIITSDHGFTNVSRDKLIHLDDIVDPTAYQILTYSPLASIFPHEGKLEEVYANLSKVAGKSGSHFKVFKKDDIPESFYYKHNVRTPPIVALADLQYSFITNMTDDEFTLKGTHGYDNDIQDMHPFFVAMGPSFKEKFEVETFNSVDIYPLMCHLLNLHPAPNNGSMKIVSQLLREGHENTMWTFGTYVLVFIVTVSVGGICIVSACRQHRYLKRKTLQLRLSPMQTTIRYSIPPKNDSNASLLSAGDDDDDEDFEDFDDARDSDKILEIVSRR